MKYFLVLLLVNSGVKIDEALLFYLNIDNQNLVNINLKDQIIIDGILKINLKSLMTLNLFEILEEKLKSKQAINSQNVQKLIFDMNSRFYYLSKSKACY